jgi:predicted unusual protein kinase regulating ubiquinone biosynthesis (AarF/ABC1/UbiB family)
MLRSGSICASLLFNYLTTSSVESTGDTKEDIYRQNLLKVRVLGETFSNYGGVLSKISQMVNYSYGIHNSDVYSNCKPINSEKTVTFFLNEILEFEDELISYDSEVFKSGSVGQIHKAVYKDGRNIIFKVQYVGLVDIFESDIYVLDTIAKYLFTDVNVTEGMLDIKKQLYEELDYRIEAKNQLYLRKCWENDAIIKIPNIIPELSNEKILCMEFVEKGESLNEFVDSSTIDEITFIGNQIIRFMFTNLFKYKVIYTDVHYGNFIIEDKSILHVLDFGSVNYIEEDIYNYLFIILKSLFDGNKDTFYQVMEDMGVINSKTKPLSQESYDYMWEYFILILAPWICKEEFQFTEKWVDDCGVRDMELMKDWILPPNVIWLNKLCHGFTHVIGKMNFKGNYIKLFTELNVF